MPKSDKRELRMNGKTKLPIFIIVNQIKKFCHYHIEKQTEGGIVNVRFRATQKFMDLLNERVFDLLEESIHNAQKENRTDLKAEDIPNLKN